MEHKCGRPTLPPSDDPKVQARREKAREYAKKKREGVKQVKVETKASATINMAIKGKIARKKMADAKEAAKPPPAPPAKVVKPRAARKPKEAKPKAELREDTNRLHNLPEDLQKKIMEMTKVEDEWTKSVMTFEDYYNTFYNFDGVKDFKKEYFDILDGSLDKSKVKALKDIPPNTTIPYEWTDLKRAKAPQAIKILKRENNKLIKLTEQKTKEDKKAFLEKALVFVFKYTNSPNTYHTYSEGEMFNGTKYKNLRALTYDYDNSIKGTRTIPMPWMNKLDQI